MAITIGILMCYASHSESSVLQAKNLYPLQFYRFTDRDKSKIHKQTWLCNVWCMMRYTWKRLDFHFNTMMYKVLTLLLKLLLTKSKILKTANSKRVVNLRL